jgi:hypothetical protein
MSQPAKLGIPTSQSEVDAPHADAIKVNDMDPAMHRGQ